VKNRRNRTAAALCSVRKKMKRMGECEK